MKAVAAADGWVSGLLDVANIWTVLINTV